MEFSCFGRTTNRWQKSILGRCPVYHHGMRIVEVQGRSLKSGNGQPLNRLIIFTLMPKRYVPTALKLSDCAF